MHIHTHTHTMEAKQTTIASFDALQTEDFLRVAESWSRQGKTAEAIFVNLSTPDIIVVDPVHLPRRCKSMQFEIGEHENALHTLKVYIGDD